jgi:hypothetical protein
MGEEADARRQEMTLKTAEALDTIEIALHVLAQRGISNPTDESTSRNRYLPKLMAANDLLGQFTEKEIGKALGLAVQAGRVVQKTERDSTKGRDVRWIEPVKWKLGDRVKTPTPL